MKKIITLIMVLTGSYLFAQPAGWLYNQPITVSNSNSVNAVDYQLKITINTQSLISAGRMTATGSDIRFGGSCGGTTLYNYWIEGGINTATTDIWVKIPFIAANGSTTFFMFYGNPGAPAASAIPGTFRGPNSATDSVTGGTSGGLLVCQRGFRFSPNQNILVTHFGKNEPTGSTRYVTLFNYTSQAIISQTQVAGPSATYTYGPISSPVWLTSGTQYVLQIYGLASDGYYFGTSSQIGQHLTYYDMQYSNGGTQNTFPTNTLASFHYGYGDLLYYITNTLVTTPTYTLAGALGSITGPTAAICGGGSATLTTNSTGTFSWSTGSTASVIVVAPTTSSVYFLVAPTNTFMCPAITVTAGIPPVSIVASATQICPTNTITLTAIGASTYTWSGTVVNGVPFAPSGTSNYTVTGTNACGSNSAVIGITVSSLPVIANVTPTLVCSGSPATLSAAGASNYTWMPGNITGAIVAASPTAATIYTVTGTTSVCAGINTVAVAVNPKPTLTISVSSSVICQGDPVNLTTGGAISYTWSPGGVNTATLSANPLSPTLFSVIGINSFSCTSSIAQIVLVNPTPTVNAVSFPTLVCKGGTVTLSASGGATTFSWNTGANGSSTIVNPIVTSIYSVTGSYTTGCNKTNTVVVNVFLPTLSVSPSSTTGCLGSLVTLAASGGTNYSWNPSGSPFAINTVTATVPTTYTVSAITSSNGVNCPGSNTVQVNVNQLPSVTAACSRTAICKGEKTIITAGGATTYTWSNAVTTITLQVSPTTGSPIYSVQGTDINGCINTATMQIKVNTCANITETKDMQHAISVFPNPNSGEFIIAGEQEVNLIIINELGQLIKTVTLSQQNNYKVSVTELAKGVYFLKGQNDHLNLNQKIIVSK
jgi:hypothetical protein